MSNIQSKITGHAKKEENTIHNKKKITTEAFVLENKRIVEEFRHHLVNAHAVTVATVAIVEIIAYFLFVNIKKADLIWSDSYLVFRVALPIVLNMIAHIIARFIVCETSVSENKKNAAILYATLFTAVVVSIIHREFVLTSCAFIFPMILSNVFSSKKLLNTTLVVAIGVFVALCCFRIFDSEVSEISNLEMLVLLGFIFVSYKCADISIVFSQKSLEVIRSQAYDNDRLKDRIRHDAMTGLFNNSTFYSLLEESMAVHHKERKKVSLAVLDLDDFKRVNDTYGHEFGDVVIISLADIMTKRCPEQKVCRYGGEEFGIIFEGESEQSAARIVKEILDEFSSYDFGFTEEKYTFSCGVVEYDGLMSKESMFGAADKKMYEAKKNGKNNIVV